MDQDTQHRNSVNERAFYQYLHDVHTKVQDVKGDNRVYTQRNPQAPQFSQMQDEGRTHGNSPGWGLREDGTPKGRGYRGVLPYKSSDQSVSTISTELATHDPIDGRPTLRPLLVPTLTKTEEDYLLSGQRGNKQVEHSIYDKADAHAVMRQATGKSTFAQQGEQHNFSFPEGETPYHKQQTEYQRSQGVDKADRFLQRSGGKDVTFDPLTSIGPSGMGLSSKIRPGWFKSTPQPDEGGFFVPLKKMLADDPHMVNKTQADYLFGRNLENRMANTMLKGPHGENADAYAESQLRYKGLHPHDQENVNRVMTGRQALDEEMVRQSLGNTGGSDPGTRSRFGFK